MEYRNLGSSGLKVSVICLGAMTFGEPTEGSMMHNAASDEATARAILERSLDAGVNFLDTADVYGNDGLSERVIGRWFADTGRRHDVVLATKFRFRMWDGPNGSGASRYRIVRAVEDSLRRLQTDHIDLYQIHMQDLDTPEEEILRALDDLVRAGKVLYVGCSNYAAYRLMDSLWTSKTLGLERFVSAQMQYNLLTRDLEREHVPLFRRHGVGMLPWSPLAAGLLTGKYSRGKAPPDDSRFAAWKRLWDTSATDRNFDIIEAVVEVAEEVGATPAQVSLAWLIQQPTVTSVIIGARKMSHLEDNLGATEVTLSADQLKRLDKASRLDLGYPYAFIRQVQGDW